MRLARSGNCASIATGAPFSPFAVETFGSLRDAATKLFQLMSRHGKAVRSGFDVRAFTVSASRRVSVALHRGNPPGSHQRAAVGSVASRGPGSARAP